MQGRSGQTDVAYSAPLRAPQIGADVRQLRSASDGKAISRAESKRMSGKLELDALYLGVIQFGDAFAHNVGRDESAN